MKKIWYWTLLFAVLITFTACSLLNDDPASVRQTGTEQSNTASQGESAGFAEPVTTATEASTADTQTDSTSATGKMIKVALYFPTEDNSALKIEEREIQVINGAILKACLLALIDGPQAQGLRKAIPDGTSIHGISIKEKVAVVDLSGEFLGAGRSDEAAARLSIVQTLTEISGVEKVRFHIEGSDMAGADGQSLGAMSPIALDEEGKPRDGSKLAEH